MRHLEQPPLPSAADEAFPTLAFLDHRNEKRGPVWYADQGAIVQLLRGKKSVALPEVVS